MENKILEIFIPGPAGRLEAKYYKSKKNTSPIALVLQPHPQYGGTMNNKVVVETFHTFMENDFSVCRVNFRGCLLYTSPSPRDGLLSRMPSSA